MISILSDFYHVSLHLPNHFLNATDKSIATNTIMRCNSYTIVNILYLSEPKDMNRYKKNCKYKLQKTYIKRKYVLINSLLMQ